MTAAQRSEQASAAARARWDKAPGPVAQVLDAPISEAPPPPAPAPEPAPVVQQLLDEDGAPQRPRTRDEFLAEFLNLTRCIDNVLVAHHGLRQSLKAPHPPFHVSMTAALKHYGPGPVFHLWCECKAVEELRLAWTGKPT
jgi:hypothetical protein